MRLASDDLRLLRDKYARMMSLREAHARAQTDPDGAAPDPRPELARLAQAFPGALREIDRLPLEVIAGRIEELGTAIEDPSRVLPWMAAQVLFHRVARGALRTKRWLAGRKAVPDLRAAFDAGDLAQDDEAAWFADDLHRVARPPRGRLMDLVHEKVAAALAISEGEARHLVFGALHAGAKRRG